MADKYSAQTAYHRRSQKSYNLTLRIREDADLIEYINQKKAAGISLPQIIRDLYESSRQ